MFLPFLLDLLKKKKNLSQESIPTRPTLIQWFLGSKEKTHSILTEQAGRCRLFTRNCDASNVSVKRCVPVLQVLKMENK